MADSRLLLCRVLLWAIAVALTMASITARRFNPATNPAEIAFSTHMARARRFACSQPQPRAVSSSDVISVGIAPEEHIMPVVTVLHRCDGGSGCCLNGNHLSCAPAEGGVENVTLAFMLGDHFTGVKRIVMVEAVNHTRCACRSIKHINRENLV